MRAARALVNVVELTAMSFMSYISDPVGDSVVVGEVLVAPAAAADRATPPDAQPVPDTSLVLFQLTSVEKFGVAELLSRAILWVVRLRSNANWVASSTSMKLATYRPLTVTATGQPALRAAAPTGKTGARVVCGGPARGAPSRSRAAS